MIPDTDQRPRVRQVVRSDGSVWGYTTIAPCPGCGLYHGMRTTPSPDGQKVPQWDFDGNLARPTFSPSIKSTMEWGEQKELRVCHFYLRNGVYQFQGDCTHHLSGQTAPAPAGPGQPGQVAQNADPA